ncbi:BBE domain-containing protein [Chitinophaga ginsengisoli]|uniref:BBE domain-containing protein n=1 Tax=Chitinophaga ginsengisoli TaxID=363837 RepID=UPI000D0D7226
MSAYDDRKSNTGTRRSHYRGDPNILGPEEYEQIDEAYGVNLFRLQKIKQQYDPSKVFNGIPIPQ